MPRFNSKLVRLKGREGAIESAFMDEFQFQTGSIKRRIHSARLPSSWKRFNSKLVRLKARR